MTLNEEKCPDGQYYCNDSKKCKPIPKGHHVMPDGKLMKGDKHSMNEVAPPTKKHERMVKHIKKAYKKDGKLTDDEKSIAYATAWKNYNKKESFGFEIDKGEHKKASKKAKMRNLAKGNTNPNEKAAAEKKAGGPKLYGEDKEMPFVSRKDRGAIRKRAKNLFKQDIKGEHHGVNEGVGRAAIGAGVGAMVGGPVGAAACAAIGASLGKKKVTSGAGGKKKPKNFFKAEPKVTRSEEMTYQEAIDAGWEMTADGIWWPPQPETVTEKISFPTFRKKVKERKPQKAQDAGARAKRKLARKDYAAKVSGSEDNVPCLLYTSDAADE